MHESTNTDFRIGIAVDAGPMLGYGHVVRCLRLANALAEEAAVVVYPLSSACHDFLSAMPEFGDGDRILKLERRNSVSVPEFPPLMITDLRDTHPIISAIQRQGSRHITIRDLGLGQCPSDVVIDGAITRIFPYVPGKDRTLCLGPQYMITRQPVARKKPTDTVLITFGGGSTAAFAYKVSEQVRRLGLKPVATQGFIGSAAMTDQELAQAMSSCRFAVSGSGVSLYDLLASGVPTIAVSFDRLQLRTADAFHEHGAVLSAGLMERLSAETFMRYCAEMLDNRALGPQMTEAGRMLVDGKGLSRVVEIVRRELWLTSQMQTFTAC